MQPPPTSVLVLLLLLAPGCTAPADRSAVVTRINHAMINADVVSVQPTSVNGARPPAGTLEAAADRLRPFVRGELRIEPMVELTMPTPLRRGLRVSTVEVGPDGIERPGKVGPDRVVLAYTRGAPGVGRGEYKRYENGHQQVVFDASSIKAMAMPFFSETDAWVLVQMHELGHALGVPAAADHVWAAGHCTDPRCVMYPRMDWRSVTAAVFSLGPPRRFCAKCRAELKAARDAGG